MKKHNKFYSCTFLVTLLFAVCNQLMGQDYKADMLRMQQVYATANSFHSTVNVKVFTQKGASSPIYTQQLEVWRKDALMYYITDGLVMIQGKKYTLWLNESSREMTVMENAKVKKPKKNGSLDLIEPQLDSLLNAHGSVTYLGKESGLKRYRITQSKGEIEQTDIFLDSKGFLRKMEYLYRPQEEGGTKNYVEVDFSTFETNIPLKESLFNEWQYISEKGGKLSPTSQYASYRLTKAKNEYNGN